jgi:hypothetical protein
LQILELEVSYLVCIASGINPTTQRTQASTVKLLASTLLNLDGDESEVKPSLGLASMMAWVGLGWVFTWAYHIPSPKALTLTPKYRHLLLLSPKKGDCFRTSCCPLVLYIKGGSVPGMQIWVLGDGTHCVAHN